MLSRLDRRFNLPTHPLGNTQAVLAGLRPHTVVLVAGKPPSTMNNNTGYHDEVDDDVRSGAAMMIDMVRTLTPPLQPQPTELPPVMNLADNDSIEPEDYTPQQDADITFFVLNLTYVRKGAS